MKTLARTALYLTVVALAACAQGTIGNPPGRAGPAYDGGDKAGGHGGGDGGGGSM
jgi:hypothetical protein